MVFDLDALAAKEEDHDWQYHITLVGKRSDPKLQQLRAAVEWLAEAHSDRVTGEVEMYFEAQFEERIKELKLAYGGPVKQAKPSQPLIMATALNGVVLYFKGERDFYFWVLKRFKYEDTTNLIMYKRRALKDQLRAMMDSGRRYISLGFSLDRQPVETVQFELFTDTVPRTVASFLEVLQNPAMLGSHIHRIVPGGWIQGGDWSKGSSGGLSQTSENGDTIADEDLARPLDQAGLLCMANSGANTNGSQYFITVKPLRSFTGKYVVIGRVISGMRVVRRIVSVPIDTASERPKAAILLLEVAKDLTLVGDEKMRQEVAAEQAADMAEAQDDEMNAAASKVQSLYRGNLARKEHTKKAKVEPVTTKKLGGKKGLKSKKQAEPTSAKGKAGAAQTAQEDVAAVQLQAAFRGAQTRKSMLPPPL